MTLYQMVERQYHTMPQSDGRTELHGKTVVTGHNAPMSLCVLYLALRARRHFTPFFIEI